MANERRAGLLDMRSSVGRHVAINYRTLIRSPAHQPTHDLQQEIPRRLSGRRRSRLPLQLQGERAS